MAIQGTVNGATIAPTFVPELNMPVASARSFFGNHSATVFMAAGKFDAEIIPVTAKMAVLNRDTNEVTYRDVTATKDVKIRF